MSMVIRKICPRCKKEFLVRKSYNLDEYERELEDKENTLCDDCYQGIRELQSPREPYWRPNGWTPESHDEALFGEKE